MKTGIFSRSIGLAAVTLGLLFGESASGAQYGGSGTVGFFVVSDLSFGPNFDYFALNGVTALGTCPTANGLVVLKLKDDAKGQRQYSYVLAAKVTGSTISVQVDDTVLDPSGYCYARQIY
jgi:hypothetical protein